MRALFQTEKLPPQRMWFFPPMRALFQFTIISNFIDNHVLLIFMIFEELKNCHPKGCDPFRLCELYFSLR
ncbi:hypothetical protein T08_14991 [Trichinella sp. T8]|nr:hypothetical protein T08_14991 [Trichinella sp. T8]